MADSDVPGLSNVTDAAETDSFYIVASSADAEIIVSNLRKIISRQWHLQDDETGTSYTFVLADAGMLKKFANASAQTVTVPPNASVAFPIGTVIGVLQEGAGQVTLAEGSGVTINTPQTLKCRAQFSLAAITKTDTNEWLISGDLEAA